MAELFASDAGVSGGLSHELANKPSETIGRVAASVEAVECGRLTPTQAIAAIRDALDRYRGSWRAVGVEGGDDASAVV